MDVQHVDVVLSIVKPLFDKNWKPSNTQGLQCDAKQSYWIFLIDADSDGSVEALLEFDFKLTELVRFELCLNVSCLQEIRFKLEAPLSSDDIIKTATVMMNSMY